MVTSETLPNGEINWLFYGSVLAPPCCVLSFEYRWGTECSWVYAIHSLIGSHECPRPFVRGWDCCCPFDLPSTFVVALLLPSISAWIHFGCNGVIHLPWSYLLHGQCSFTLFPRDKHIFQLHVTCSQHRSWFGHAPPLPCMNCRRAHMLLKLISMYWKTFPYLSKKGVSIWLCELPSLQLPAKAPVKTGGWKMMLSWENCRRVQTPPLPGNWRILDV